MSKPLNDGYRHLRI